MNRTELESWTNSYLTYLEMAERSLATRKQYQRDILAFLHFLNDTHLNKESVIRYKEYLQTVYKATSVNAKLAAINSFFTFLGRSDLKVKLLRIQKQTYCSQKKILTKAEYMRLVKTARQQKNQRLEVLLQTICGTGIRVSELRFITAEAVHQGEATIQLKGKNRTILIPGKLCHILKKYLQKQKIATGPVFVTRNGIPLNRSNIWKMMKALCQFADVEASRVFPHNLRHLFARAFYSVDHDIAKLADILGHSNINTTRIYIISSGQEHRKQMDSLGFVF